MIKATELRIGNLVYYTGKKGVVNFQIKVERVKDGYINDIGLVWHEPIPLTEEWLLKAGFGRSDEHELGCNVPEPFCFYWDYHFNRFRLECGDGDEYIPHIQYVHQLQNLYFALTGTELEFSEAALAIGGGTK